MPSLTTFILMLICLIASVSALALKSTTITPSNIDPRDTPAETLVLRDTITLRSKSDSDITSATLKASRKEANRKAGFMVPEPENTTEIIGLGAIVPILAVGATAAAIAFRLYRDRCEQRERAAERKAAEEKAPEEFIRHATPIELEARELGMGRYSPT